MGAAKKIRIMLVEREMTLKELSENDLKQIADILDFDYEAVFTDRQTGKKI